jgi:hypothetical protein
MGIKEIGDRIIVVTARSERQIDRRNYLYIALPPISYFYIWCDAGGEPQLFSQSGSEFALACATTETYV